MVFVRNVGVVITSDYYWFMRFQMKLIFSVFWKQSARWSFSSGYLKKSFIIYQDKLLSPNHLRENTWSDNYIVNCFVSLAS